jgi:organic radical activating enzyme
MKYNVVEIFYSIQGEGCNTGMPAIFIRLAGCNQQCSFCDTNHKVQMELTEEEIVKECHMAGSQRVIITGGEPFIQNLDPLITLLKAEKYQVFIETNGTVAVKTNMLDKIDWIAMSPKGPVRLSRWNEVKIITDQDTDVNKLIPQIQQLLERCPESMIFLQPCCVPDSVLNQHNLQFTIQLVKELPRCYLSLQTHKMINIR